MRLLAPSLAAGALAVAASLSGCTEHGKGGGIVCLFMGETHVPGDFFSAGDGCNFCECIAEGNVGRVSCSQDRCGDGGVPVDTIDPDDRLCAPSGGCAGPLCGGACCGQGEQCIDGVVCSCGGNQSCANGDLCASGGPIGGGTCGDICCGSINNPCPL